MSSPIYNLMTFKTFTVPLCFYFLAFAASSFLKPHTAEFYGGKKKATIIPQCRPHYATFSHCTEILRNRFFSAPKITSWTGPDPFLFALRGHRFTFDANSTALNLHTLQKRTTPPLECCGSAFNAICPMKLIGNLTLWALTPVQKARFAGHTSSTSLLNTGATPTPPSTQRFSHFCAKLLQFKRQNTMTLTDCPNNDKSLDCRKVHKEQFVSKCQLNQEADC